jgi:alpha-1,6-mannosyltransferase
LPQSWAMNTQTLSKQFYFLKNLPAWLPFGVAVVGSAVAYGLLAYATHRTNVEQLLALFGGLFLLYGLVLWWPWSRQHVQWWLAVAIGFRLLLLFAFPNLSDDYARFVWDGRLLAHGFNPYLYLPTQLLQSPILMQAGLSEELFLRLNSPQYFTVYPPLNQAIFGAAAWLSGSNLMLNLVYLRVIVILAEIGTIWLLYTSVKPKYVLLYALNPLVVVELTGNLHFEAVMIFFIVLSFRWLERQWVWSAIAMTLAVATKLLPLLFLPLVLRQLGWRRGVLYSSLVIAGVGLLFLPFSSSVLFQNVGSSLDLYFQKFEFNASLYYLLGKVGFWVKGYNIIQTLGPVLSLVAGLVIAGIAFVNIPLFSTNVYNRALFSLLLYFVCATTVHPWYVATLVALSAFTGFRFPVVWSGFIVLSYAAYATTPVQENGWLLWLEYGVLAICVVAEFMAQNKAAKAHKLGAAANP